ncbi:MAG: CdaR family protein [Desulfocapsaceae bacterium]|nr:CdaR family protein [Desulfocapsaceae bacterium]
MKQLKFHNLQKLWSKEWLLRFISLCLAILLWYFVGGQDAVDTNVTIPIEIINMPKDLIISNKFKKNIDVTVRGPRSLLIDIGKKGTARQVDLSDAVPGTRVVTIDNKSISVGRGIQVLRVQPSSLILSLDKLIQKKFSVTPVMTGSVAPGYVLKNLQIAPDTIAITGPQTVLSQVESLKTIPINIGGLAKSVQQQIPLDLEPALVDLIGETSITADIVIGYDVVEKTVTNVPVRFAVDGYLQQVVPDEVKVTLKIPKLHMKKDMDYKSLFTVSAVGKPGEDGLKVQVTPTDPAMSVEVVKVEPGSVSLVKKPAPKKPEPEKRP